MAVDQARAMRKAGEIIKAEVIARARKIGVKKPAVKTPASVRLSVRGNKATISAGGPDAPAAAMFETPGARHPLFGDEEHWYTQPYRPFLEQAAEAKADEAMKAYADDLIQQMLDDSGL